MMPSGDTLSREDRAVWKPLDDLGDPPPSVTGLSAMEELILIDAFGLDRCCCEGLIGWAHRGADESQREVPVILGEPGSGKTTMIDALSWGIPPQSVYGVMGQTPDKFASEKIMLAAFVFVDEAQDLKTEGFSVLKGATGIMITSLPRR